MRHNGVVFNHRPSGENGVHVGVIVKIEVIVTHEQRGVDPQQQHPTAAWSEVRARESMWSRGCCVGQCLCNQNTLGFLNMALSTLFIFLSLQQLVDPSVHSAVVVVVRLCFTSFSFLKQTFFFFFSSESIVIT